MESKLFSPRSLSPRSLVGVTACLLTFVTTSAAETLSVTGWRGDGSGRFADAEPPTTWSKDSENILWKVEVGRGYSCPVRCAGDGPDSARLFITGEPAELLCLHPTSGEILWRKTVDYAAALGEAEAKRIADTLAKFEAEKRADNKEYDQLRKSDPDSPRLQELKEKRQEIDKRRREFEKDFPSERRGGAGNAAATVLCDGERVFALFGTGIVAAFRVNGERLWIKQLQGGPEQGFGHSASPVLAGGRLIVHVRELVALDVMTGDVQWTADVPAKFGSPAVAQVGGKDLIITASGMLVRAADGKVLAEKQFKLSNNSPLVHDGILYV
ncbi:MAG: PQQ-like beta-propeller repeat protein, partial [Planctomycetales bacterium]